MGLSKIVFSLGAYLVKKKELAFCKGCVSFAFKYIQRCVFQDSTKVYAI